MAGLKRSLNPMPDDVRVALTERGLMATYGARPDYQKNDYLGWIVRLDQMLDELQRGGVYMNMAWRG